MRNTIEYTDLAYLPFPTEKLLINTLVLRGIIKYEFVTVITNRMKIVGSKLLM